MFVFVAVFVSSYVFLEASDILSVLCLPNVERLSCDGVDEKIYYVVSRQHSTEGADSMRNSEVLLAFYLFAAPFLCSFISERRFAQAHTHSRFQISAVYSAGAC